VLRVQLEQFAHADDGDEELPDHHPLDPADGAETGRVVVTEDLMMWIIRKSSSRLHSSAKARPVGRESPLFFWADRERRG
jgi:hypothetical protein